ncbi:roadblock/LC7 domain-containing protein [Dactylosporangium sp. CA-139066]|uniref:roadblock/LC7 domain-containing protein n=1 Tax=Dactylosporangium sp. CA-139066 TaxID=3239930 RepID=UPI003D904A50
MGQDSTAPHDLSWLMQDFVHRIDDVQHAVVLSADGLRIASSDAIGRDDAEHLSAVASGMQSLTRSVATRFPVGPIQQTIIQYDKGFLFVMAAGHGACLTVLAGPDADAGLVAYEMAMLITRAEEHLAAQPRPHIYQASGG